MAPGTLPSASQRTIAPIDVAEGVVAAGGAGLGETGEQQIGADGQSRRDADIEIRKGVISEPAPTPVMPTRKPTRNPPP